MNKINKIFCVFNFICFFIFTSYCNAIEANKKISATIFVENNLTFPSSEIKASYTKEFNDYITSSLTGAGISVIDKKYVIEKFKSGDDENVEIRKKLEQISEVKNFIENENLNDDSQKVESSTLSTARNLMADYIVIAGMSSFGYEDKNYYADGSHYKGDLLTRNFILRTTLKINNIKDGGTVFSKTLVTNKKSVVSSNQKGINNDLLHSLLYDASIEIGKAVKENVSEIKTLNAKKEDKEINFKVECNVEGANVELDGVMLGAVPFEYRTAKGVHYLKVVKEGYKNFERPINVLNDNQVFIAHLEQTTESIKKQYEIKNIEQDLKEREANIEIAKEQSKSISKSRDEISKGEKEKRKNSFEKIKTDVDTVYIEK